MRKFSVNLHSLLNRIYAITEKWYFFATVLAGVSLIAFFVNDISFRIFSLIIFLMLAFFIKLGVKKMIEGLYLAQTKGLLLKEINRKWLISYNENTEQFEWKIMFEQLVKNVGKFKIKDLPYAEISSQYEQRNVYFEAYQLTENNKRVNISGDFERYTDSMHLQENKRIKVFRIRKYLHLSEPIKPKTVCRIVTDISFTHSKNLLKEEGFIGVYSQYPRLIDNIELEVALPLEISTFEYEILSPFGNTDSILYEITNEPEKDVVGNRKISWSLVNPIPNFDYYIKFLVKKVGDNK